MGYQYHLENGVALDIEADVTPYRPAKISGPPEACYPEEGGEAEITKCTIAGLEKVYQVLNQYRSDLRHPVTDEGSITRRLEAIEAAKVKLEIEFEPWALYVKNSITGEYVELATLIEEEITNES